LTLTSVNTEIDISDSSVINIRVDIFNSSASKYRKSMLVINPLTSNNLGLNFKMGIGSKNDKNKHWAHMKRIWLFYSKILSMFIEKGFFIYMLSNEPFYLGQIFNGLDKLVMKLKNTCKYKT